jgi:23S rRNA (guanine2445-N2)-methyltransferase / 23S rRNA (guanine2069-N7)-methyltransferase
LLITNPPTGNAWAKRTVLKTSIKYWGKESKQHFQGWSAGVFTAYPELAKQMGIRARKKYRLFNGPIPCNLFNFDVREEWFMHQKKPGRPLPRVGKPH